MIPKPDLLSNLRIGEDVEIIDEPSATFSIDLETGEVGNIIDDINVMKHSIFDKLYVKRYEYIIHDWNYGIEIDDLFGKAEPYVRTELERRIKEALFIDERILKITNFRILSTKDDTFKVSFFVETTLGEIDMKEVAIGV